MFEGLFQPTHLVIILAIAVFVFYQFLPNRKIEPMQVLPAAIIAGVAAELVKDIYVFLLPWMDIRDNQGSQGPFFMSAILPLDS